MRANKIFVSHCKMDLQREHLTHLDFKSRLKPGELYHRLQIAFMDHNPSRTTVYRWYNESKHGPLNLGVEKRIGRLKKQ